MHTGRRNTGPGQEPEKEIQKGIHRNSGKAQRERIRQALQEKARSGRGYGQAPQNRRKTLFRISAGTFRPRNAARIGDFRDLGQPDGRPGVEIVHAAPPHLHQNRRERADTRDQRRQLYAGHRRQHPPFARPQQHPDHLPQFQDRRLQRRLDGCGFQRHGSVRQPRQRVIALLVPRCIRRLGNAVPQRNVQKGTFVAGRCQILCRQPHGKKYAELHLLGVAPRDQAEVGGQGSVHGRHDPHAGAAAPRSLPPAHHRQPHVGIPDRKIPVQQQGTARESHLPGQPLAGGTVGHGGLEARRAGDAPATDRLLHRPGFPGEVAARDL